MNKQNSGKEIMMKANREIHTQYAMLQGQFVHGQTNRSANEFRYLDELSFLIHGQSVYTHTK